MQWPGLAHLAGWVLLLSSGENIVVNKIFSLINIKISLSKEIIDYLEYSVSLTDIYKVLKNSLIIQEQNTKKNHKRVVVLYVIKNHVNLHKL